MREERRRLAEERNQRARRTKKARQEIAQLEQAIEALEAEKAGLEGDLANPATYAGKGKEAVDIAALRKRHHEVEAELTELLARWEQASSELEVAETERDSGRS